MKNFVQEGEQITITAAADVLSGAGVLLGNLFGIATHDASTGDELVLRRRGVVTHAKTSAQAWTVGARIYWDDGNDVFTTTASGNTLVGCAAAAAANPSSEGTVLLDGTIR